MSDTIIKKYPRPELLPYKDKNNEIILRARFASKDETYEFKLQTEKKKIEKYLVENSRGFFRTIDLLLGHKSKIREKYPALAKFNDAVDDRISPLVFLMNGYSEINKTSRRIDEIEFFQNNGGVSWEDCYIIIKKLLLKEKNIEIPPFNEEAAQSQYPLLDQSTEKESHLPKDKYAKSDYPNLFIVQGDFYLIRYNGQETTFLKKSLGLYYISLLLQSPRQDINSSILINAASANIGLSQISGSRIVKRKKKSIEKESLMDNFITTKKNDNISLLDKRGIEVINERINKLKKEIQLPENFGNQVLIEQFENEIDQLERYLKKSQRPLQGPSKKLQNAIRISIERAYVNMEKHKDVKPLVKHLKKAIRGGVIWGYFPNEDTVWTTK